MNVTITIPDTCELIKDGNTYIVKEKKQEPPRSWDEFCKMYPISEDEYFISAASELTPSRDTSRRQNTKREIRYDKNLCVSKEEAEAFLALIQLRQLRKAWVGDWEQPNSNTETTAILYSVNTQEVMVHYSNFWASNVLSFPTEEVAQEFLECFKDLCESAKTLL